MLGRAGLRLRGPGARAGPPRWATRWTPAALGRGQQYLADTVAAGKCTECGWGCVPPAPSTRVFALYALARTGAPRASYLAALYAEREKLPLFARAMLADAMFVGGGDRAQARSLLTEVLNHARCRTARSTWRTRRGRRAGPLVLRRPHHRHRPADAHRLAPDHPFVGKMAAWLVSARGRDGRYRNTQEAAFALSALAEVVRTKEREVPTSPGG